MVEPKGSRTGQTGGASGVFGIVRKATKAVVYTAVPISGPLKVAAMGTRNQRLNRKEMEKQTALLAQQNALLASGGAVAPMVTPDGKWVSYDGGNSYRATQA
jgi:hypothetical protein